MKKTIVLGIVVLGSFGWASFSYAESGACSYHGGVNCAAISSTGNAICNDGFQSSTSYNFSDECKVSCSYPTALDCNEGAVTLRNNMNGNYFDPASINEEYACKSQHILYESQVATYNACISTKQSSPKVIYSLPQDIKVTPSPDPVADCPLNAHMQTNGNCHCNDGYANSGNNSCISYSTYCPANFGDNSYSVGNDCFCFSGYSFSKASNSCEKIVTPVVQVPTIKAPIVKQEIKKPARISIPSITATTSSHIQIATSTQATSTEIVRIKEIIKQPSILGRFYSWFTNWFN